MVGEVRYFQMLKSFFKSEKYSCKDRRLLEGRDCIMCHNTLTEGDVMQLKCCGSRRDGKGCRIHIHRICFITQLPQRFTRIL